MLLYINNFFVKLFDVLLYKNHFFLIMCIVVLIYYMEGFVINGMIVLECIRINQKGYIDKIIFKEWKVSLFL